MNIIKSKKSQGGMEFLITYGWTILVSLVVLGTLAYFGILGTSACKYVTGFHAGFDSFVVLDHKITGTDSPVANSVYMKIASKTRETFVIKKLRIYKDEQYCGESLGGEFVVDDKTYALLIGGPLSSECIKKTGNCYKFDTELIYSKRGGLNHTDRGRLTGAFESHESYSFTQWKRTDFNGQVSKEESSSFIGSYEDNCPGIPPAYNFVPVTGTIYWDLPQEGRCYSSQAANKGFAIAYCSINIPYLSHGWVTTNLTVNPMLQGNDFYLIGSADYIDEQGQQQHNGICINDNLYFYVNGNIIGKGGTTGAMGNQDNKIDPGEEVLRSCEGCYDIDASAWCIPPVKLTTEGASFRYGEPNVIMVLVEDFCFPYGYAHAGGLKPFSFYFVE